MVRRLSPQSVHGVCGWSNSDLRQLPDASIADLATLFADPNHLEFPKHLTRAKVAVFGKVKQPRLPSHGRPITILSNRWGRVLCVQVLRDWSVSMPPAVQGCLKHRCSTDLCFGLQSEAEEALSRKANCTGAAIDLRRAFNTLPRRPMLVT